MSHDEFDFEPIPGLPANLPPGEKLLWQGSPTWSATASRVLHIRAVSGYFAAVLLIRLVGGRLAEQDWHTIGVSLLWLAALGVATIAFLAWVARMIALCGLGHPMIGMRDQSHLHRIVLFLVRLAMPPFLALPQVVMILVC